MFRHSFSPWRVWENLLIFSQNITLPAGQRRVRRLGVLFVSGDAFRGVAFQQHGLLLSGGRRECEMTRSTYEASLFFSFYNTHIHRHSIPTRLSACLLACFALASVDAASISTKTVPHHHPLFVQRILFEVEAAIVRGSSRARMF